MNMLWMQSVMDVRRILRNKYYVISSLTMPILFYVIFTRLVQGGSEGMDAGEWQARYLMSMTTFSIMGTAILQLGIRNVEERSKGWALFMRITPLPASIYFLSKMIAQSVIHLLSIVVIFIAGMLINDIQLSWATWLFSGCWIFLAAFPFLALGTLLGTMKRVDTAAGVGNLFYFALAITGGMWMPIEMFPDIMQAIGKWLPSYSFGSGAWDLVSGEAPKWRDAAILIGYMVLFMVLSSYIRKKQEAV
ncbi:ABC transporter permease [Marinicrinis lubricantis]|uniref:ABC transporter permease n=1 Tax=Marinicrinis lubricantis TaxID=2086470 RepID=A0ABW1ILM0_9BACL